MKSLKKTLVLLVVLSMILSAVSPVFAFNDAIPEEYAEQVNKMAAFGVFSGDQNGNFNANNNITRAEMAKVICKLMGVSDAAAKSSEAYSTDFIDVPAGQWFTGWVALAAGNGVINGFPDGTFRPNEYVTNDQVLTMIVRTLGFGELVDKKGTWPANYVGKAAELKLFEDVPATDSALATRGTVAIYCYNALTAPTWDITSIEEGVATSTKSKDTLLAKYFSNFTNEDGEMKLVEEAKVEVCGATTNSIGANQVQLSATGLVSGERTGLNLAQFIEADKAPKKGEEEVTYKITTGTDAGEVVAYIPEGVANIASLAGKTVNVMFGKDNEVAYIEVVDDAVESTYVTAYDDEKRIITIDGEKIDLADIVEVSVFGHAIANDNIAYKDDQNQDVAKSESIKTLFAALTNSASTKRTIARNIFADYTLDANDEIETINFTFAAEYNANNVKVEEFVVEKRNGEKLTVAGSSTKINLEDYEDAEPRVIKNGEVADLEDIVAGDVLTRVSYKGDVEIIYVTSNTVEGAIEDYDTVTVILDGTEYVASLDTNKVFANEEGETDDYKTKTLAELYTAFKDEDVTAYLNMAGEIVAVVGESEATGYVLGLITYDAERVKDRNSKRYYLDLEILSEDGEQEYYSIYHEDSDEDMTSTDEAKYEAGKVVVFSADADGIIKSDEIKLVEATDANSVYNFASNDKVQAIRIAAADLSTSLAVNKANKTIEVKNAANPHENADKTYYYKSTTTLVDAKEEEIMSKWASITNGDAFAAVETGSYVYLFVKGTKLVYVVAEVSSRGTTELQYGMVASKVYRGEEDDEFLVDVLVDGVVETYECAEGDKTALNGAYDKYAEVGGLISFNLSDGKLKNITPMFSLDYIDYLDEKDEDDIIVVDETAYATDKATLVTNASYLGITADTTTFETIKVTEVEADEDIVYVTLNDAKIIELAEDYVAYRLATNELVEEVEEGDFIVYFDNDDGYQLVIILN